MTTQTVQDQLANEYAPAWRPDPGDSLVGEIISLDERDGGYGPYPIIGIRRADGTEASFHALHNVAQTELAKLEPRIGETIGIRYRGLVSSANARGSYHAYTVKMDRPSASGVNWGRYGAEPPADAFASDVPSDVPAPRAAADDDSDPLPF